MPKEVTLDWEEYCQLTKIDYEYVSGLEGKLAELTAAVEALTLKREELEMVIRDQRRELRELQKNEAFNYQQMVDINTKLKRENAALQSRLAHALADAQEAKRAQPTVKPWVVPTGGDFQIAPHDPNVYTYNTALNTDDAPLREETG